jgi:hypothetical protein
VILVACLTPSASSPPEGFCLICGEQGTAGLLLNVVLYLPLGLSLALFRGWRAAVAACFLLSAGVEAAQLLIPGRHGALADLLANTVGGALGAALGVRPRAWLFPRPTAERLAAAAAALGAAALIVTSALLVTPTVPGAGALFAQFTPRLAGSDQYQGRLLDAEIGGIRLAHGVIDRDGIAAALLEDSLSVGISVALGPPTDRLAPVLRVVDHTGLEAFQVGVDGTDLVIRYRYRADDLRLARPELRVEDWTAGLEVGDTVRVVSRRDPSGATEVSVAGRDAVTVGHTVGGGWRFLRGLPGPLRDGAGLVDWLWLAAIVVPVGWWAGSLAGLAAWGVALLALMISVPSWTPAIAAPVGQIAAAVAGLGIGRALRLLVDGSF